MMPIEMTGVSLTASGSGEGNEVTDNRGRDVIAARVFLRERFLRAVMSMNGKHVDFHMYENTHVSGVFGGCDREFVNIYVRNLMTPLGQVSDAILRTNDIESIRIQDINPSL